jgi:protein archease
MATMNVAWANPIAQPARSIALMAYWELFDHTADVGLRVRAESLQSLFQAAAEGLFATIVSNLDSVSAVDMEEFSLEAEGPAELLVLWLNELIFRCETRHRVYSQFAPSITNDGCTLKAIIKGESINRDRHILDHEIKAATRHGLLLNQSADGWYAEVILDI